MMIKGIFLMVYDQKKLAFFLPNTFTALNMACGFAAIFLSFNGDFYKASMLIVLGAVFDSVDGRIARWTGTQSSFGEQFDSMSDLVTFGISPAILFYFRFLSHSGRVGMVLTFFFTLCGALRLARFNANIDKFKSDYFQGLPIPGAATAIVGWVLLSLALPHLAFWEIVSFFYILFYSILMISNVPFPSFKNSPWVKGHKRQVFIILVLICLSILIYEEVMIPLVITTYVICSLIYVLVNREKFSGIFDWKDESE
jgi:CDP-diacylglycerol---serine O-phosphatidyltransferase